MGGCDTLAAPQIPVINLTGEAAKPGASPTWPAACQEVRRALEDYGCLEVVYDKPPSGGELHDSVIEALEEVFSLPLETKMKNVNPVLGFGYMGQIPALPNYEGLGIDHAVNEEACQEFTNLMWPEGNPHFCEVMHNYAVTAAEVQKLVARMLFDAYGIDKQKHDAHANSTTYLVRLLSYNNKHQQATNNNNNNNKAATFKGHTDKTFISIIHQNHVNGLEVRTKDGLWVHYRPSSRTSSFAVIAGDVAMAWSSDRIKSCYHRVLVDGEDARYAVGLFSFLGGIIEPPEELVDEEHPLQYKPFYHKALLEFYTANTSQNKSEGNTVKAYCGI